MDDKKKGFAGLSELSTDIDNIINMSRDKISIEDLLGTDIDNISSKKKEKSSQKNKPKVNNENVEVKNTDNSGSLSWLWLLGIIGLIIWSPWKNNDSYKKSSSTILNQQKETTKDPLSSIQVQHNEEELINTYQESKPTKNAITANKHELLYCVAEKMRLSIVKNKFNSLYNLTKYNNLIDDYNSRCSNIRYYENDMNYVEREIKKRKKEIEREGLLRFENTNNPNIFTQSVIQNRTSQYSLTVITMPSDARVKIMNIKPIYYDGIKLKKGKYHIRVLKKGFKTYDKWVQVEKNKIVSINLSKNNNNYVSSKKHIGLPTHAKLNYYGSGWECKRGYRKQGNQCLQVGVYNAYR